MLHFDKISLHNYICSINCIISLNILYYSFGVRVASHTYFYAMQFVSDSIYLMYSIFCQAVKLWNELPRNIQRADSITTFKKTV